MHGKISCNNKISFSGFSIIMEMAAFELEVFKYSRSNHPQNLHIVQHIHSIQYYVFINTCIQYLNKVKLVEFFSKMVFIL